MSVVKRYYPSTYTNPSGFWINPQNAMNVEDNLCAVISDVHPNGDYYLNLATLKDTLGNPINLPSNAILDKLLIAFKWAGTVINSNSFYEILLGELHYQDYLGNYWTPTTSATHELYSCASTYYDLLHETVSVTSNFPTVAYLNAQSFRLDVDMEIVQQNPPFYGTYYLDAAYLEITYHLPVTAVTRGDGLTWIVAQAKRNLPKWPFFKGLQKKRGKNGAYWITAKS